MAQISIDINKSSVYYNLLYSSTTYFIHIDRWIDIYIYMCLFISSKVILFMYKREVKWKFSKICGKQKTAHTHCGVCCTSEIVINITYHYAVCTNWYIVYVYLYTVCCCG